MGNDLEKASELTGRDPPVETDKHDGKTDLREDEENINNNQLMNGAATSEVQQIQWEYLTFETDLPLPVHQSSAVATQRENITPPGCPNLQKYENPFLWSKERKAGVTILSVIATSTAAYAAGSYTSGLDQMMRLWNVSQVAALVGVTTFTIGFGVAPLFLAPFSEINGRKPVFVVTGILYAAMQLACALTPTYAGIIVARFLAGCFGSTFSTMVGGVVADIFVAKDRNTAMALFAGGALFGNSLGPLISGWIAQYTTWRWIFYLQAITCGVLQVFIVAFFPETRGSVILSRKAKALNKWYAELEQQGFHGVLMNTPSVDSLLSQQSRKPVPQRIRWKVKADEERASIFVMISISLYRPIHLLVTEPTVFFFSLWASFSWGILYLTFSAVPLIFQTHHGFNIAQADSVFASPAVAVIISTILAIYQERIAKTVLPERLKEFVDTPEGRLCGSCVQSFLLPIGLFWLGWTSFPNIQWIVPTLAVGVATMGIFSTYLAVFNYLADTYGRYASSALAAQSFCRNMLCGAFPLFTDQMYRALTYQGASSLLGGIAILLSVVPWVLVVYGPRIRARSKFARELVVNPY